MSLFFYFFIRLKLSWVGSCSEVNTPCIPFNISNLFIPLNTGFSSSPFSSAPFLFEPFILCFFFPCSVHSFSLLMLIIRANSNHLTESIQAVLSFNSNSFNQKLFTLTSGKYFGQEQKLPHSSPKYHKNDLYATY